MAQNWTNSVKATFNAYLMLKDHSRGIRRPAPDEPKGLASALSDEDVDAMSLHSNVGGSKRSEKRRRGKGKKKQRDAWGVVGRNLSMNSRRSMQMFGWYPFGSANPSPYPNRRMEKKMLDRGKERGGPGRYRTRPTTRTLLRSRAATLCRANDGGAKEEELGVDASQFESDITNEDLEREERELAEQEEAVAVYALSFPAVSPTPAVEPLPNPNPRSGCSGPGT
ncbi:hypothetical protein FRC04_000704 [Tulasnella sp. 424]|nr:hypothetical protein FRC04_000704 [Tulasnella sp. 424]